LGSDYIDGLEGYNTISYNNLYFTNLIALLNESKIIKIKEYDMIYNISKIIGSPKNDYFYYDHSYDLDGSKGVNCLDFTNIEGPLYLNLANSTVIIKGKSKSISFFQCIKGSKFSDYIYFDPNQ
jgi:hypothetical protein